MSLIEKDEALKRVEDAPVLSPMSLMTKSYIYAGIKTMPDVDAVPIVRCKDCKHGEMRKNCYGDDMVECSNPDSPVRDYALTALFLPDWFCADGERKEE